MLPLITLLTDFGTADTYVAQMKGVIYSLLPEARIVDITHDIEPQDIIGGALALAETVPLYPPGTIHVAVVDPGVGTDRRILCVEVAEQLLILPDNGLLSFLLDRFPLTHAHEVTDRSLGRSEVSRTFHGRDIMAPVAARLALGTPMTRVGPPVENVKRLELPRPEITSRSVRGVVIAVDRFGNAISNILESMLPNLFCGKSVNIQLASGCIKATCTATYGDRQKGETAVLIGSQGRVEIAIVNESAAQRYGMRKGDKLCIEF